jgi:hypothetical protein
LVVAAWLTYLVDPEDVVWRFIKGASDARLLEHIGFGVAAAAIGAGILLGSWRTDRDFIAEGWTAGSIRRRCLGEILHGIGIASLVPVAGFVILVAGETIRSVRYARLEMRIAPELLDARRVGRFPAPAGPAWKWVVLSQGFAWCAFVSMVIFSVVLLDRVADYLFLGTIMIAMATRAMLPRENFVPAE